MPDSSTSTPVALLDSNAGSASARPPAGLFVRNMSALWRKDPKLAQRVDDVPDGDRFEIITARSGDPTCRMRSEAGSTLLHSKYNPAAEAEKLIDTIPLEDKFCYIVCGLGLGYHVRELYERLCSGCVIIVCEPSLPLLSTAFAHVDLSDMIESGRLVLLDRLDKAEVHDKLRPHNTLMMLGAQIVVHPPSDRIAGGFHSKARTVVTDYVAYSRMTLLTLVGNSQVTCRNIAHNLPKYLTTPPINVLRDRFKGFPAVVISGGPSLRKNIDLLASMKGKAVLIAVQSMFKPLMDRGIVPDFVTTLDFHSMSQQFFSGLQDVRDVHVIAEPKVSWHVLDAYDGPVSLLHSGFVEQLIGPALAGRDGLPPGATVAHLCFYLAQYLGCDPIVFVGQDLAFTGHCFYIPGVEVHKTWRSELNRFNSMETKEWERIVRNRTILRTINDINGRPIYTDDLLLTYLEQFERDFTTTSARVIDATEGGARMRGSVVMPLSDVIEQHCGRSIPNSAFAYRRECQWNETSKVAAARSELAQRVAEIERIDALCDEMLALLKELEDLVDDPPRFNQRLVRVDELRTVVTDSYRAYRIVNSATQMAELRRFTADRKLEATNKSGPKRALHQLSRDAHFVQSVRDGARTMVDILQRTIERLDVLTEPDAS